MSIEAEGQELVSVYIGIGSNLMDPEQQVRQALSELTELNEGEWIASGLYSSPPMGPSDQPDYVNAVARFETHLSPEALLDWLQQLELKHGREKAERWGARTLDLDILLYNDCVIEHETLTVPHPGIAKRDFVLRPLFEVEPMLIIPGLGSVEALLNTCEMQGAKRYAD